MTDKLTDAEYRAMKMRRDQLWRERANVATWPGKDLNEIARLQLHLEAADTELRDLKADHKKLQVEKMCVVMQRDQAREELKAANARIAEVESARDVAEKAAVWALARRMDRTLELLEGAEPAMTAEVQVVRGSYAILRDEFRKERGK